MAAQTWEGFWYRITPRWLRDAYADALHTAIGGLSDVIRLGTLDATKLGLVSEAGSEGVRAIARERQIDPLPVETVEALRARIADAWDHWGDSGTDSGLTALLRAYTLASDLEVMDVVNDDAHLDFDGTPNADSWSRLWVSVPDGHYSAPTIGPGLVVGPGTLVGVDMTVTELKAFRGVFAKYRPAHVVGAGLFVNTSATVYAPGDPTAVAAGETAGDIAFIPLHVDTVGPRISVGTGLVVGHVYT